VSAARLSLPHEHGAWLTLAGSAAAAALLAPAKAPALGAALAVGAGFLLRAPVDKLGARKPLAQWDLPALPLLLALAATGALLAGRLHPAGAWLAGAAAVALPGASLLARVTRRQRAPWVELAAMAALGTTAGVMAWAGGCAMHKSIALSIALAAHAAASVPLVRTELRRRERDGAAQAAVTALAMVGSAGVLLLLDQEYYLCFALVPRLLHAGLRLGGVPGARSAARAGGRETAALAAVVALAVLLA
jgi:hypothetical protein